MSTSGYDSPFKNRMPQPDTGKKKKKKRREFKLPKGKIGVGLLIGGAVVGYAATNMYFTGPDDAVYAINMGHAAVELQEGWDLPFFEDQVHLTWPFSDVAPFPLSSHAVVPLSVDFQGTIKGSMYSVHVNDLDFQVRDNAIEAYVMRYGSYSFGEKFLQTALENDVHGLTGLVEILQEGGGEVDGATQAVQSDIYNALWFVLKGKSVEYINQNMADPVFVDYLIDEIEDLIPSIQITNLDIDAVYRSDGVVSFTTADGFLVDMYASRDHKVLDLDEEKLQEVLGQYNLMEFRHGTLPVGVKEELVATMGLDVQTVATQDRLSRMENPELMGLGFNSGGSRVVTFELGNAEEQFYRTFFNSRILTNQYVDSLERLDANDLVGAADILEGVVEYSKLFPLTPQSEKDMMQVLFELGFIYEDLSITADFEDDFELWEDYHKKAGFYFLEYLQTPRPHTQKTAITEHLWLSYGDIIDFSQLEIDLEADLGAPVQEVQEVVPEGEEVTGPTEEAPVEEETPEATSENDG